VVTLLSFNCSFTLIKPFFLNLFQHNICLKSSILSICFLNIFTFSFFHYFLLLCVLILLLLLLLMLLAWFFKHLVVLLLVLHIFIAVDALSVQLFTLISFIHCRNILHLLLFLLVLRRSSLIGFQILI
jgi:hypothetical protein